MAQYGNPGAALIQGAVAGQALRQGYEDNKGRQATKKFFEKLQSFSADDLAPAAGVPVPDSGGSEGMEALQGAAVGALPTDGSAIQPKAKKKYRSATPEDINELDTLAAQAATAGGDPKVYEALRGTARSYMQSKVLDNMRRAQVALQVGDNEGLEDAIHSAYRYIPDGKELKLSKNKEGQLMFRHPVSDQDLPVTSESLALFTKAAMDPTAFEETIYGRKKDKIEQGQKDRALATDERGAAVNERNAAVSEAELAEKRRAAGVKEKADAANDAVTRLKNRADAIQSLAYADYLGKGGAKGKTGGGDDMDKQRKFAGDVMTATRQYIMPTQVQKTTDEFGGEKVINAPAPRLPGFEQADEATVNTVSSYAEQIGIANPKLGISQAVGAGAAIHQALKSGGNVHVDPASGLLGVPIGGKMQTFRVPPELIQMLMQESGGPKPRAAPSAVPPSGSWSPPPAPWASGPWAPPGQRTQGIPTR